MAAHDYLTVIPEMRVGEACLANPDLGCRELEYANPAGLAEDLQPVCTGLKLRCLVFECDDTNVRMVIYQAYLIYLKRLSPSASCSGIGGPSQNATPM